MRAVLDTNVLVSRVFWAGIPARVLDLWRTGEFQVVASNAILAEYLEVIARLAAKTGRRDLTQKWQTALVTRLVLVEPEKAYEGCRDPADNCFVTCALAAQVEYIVSGDKDLLALVKIGQVQVVSPRTFLIRLSRKG